MKVRAIRLREVGCFREAVALECLSGGLDVLAGPNEMGKSTLFKALRALFVVQHTSNSVAVRGLRPYAGGNPLIEADFEVGAHLYRLRKQFLGGKSAILQDLGNGAVLARGPDAERELAGLLGVDEVQPKRFDLMWVHQKGTLEPTAIPPEARTALDAAIAAEVEVAAGGARARAIGQRVAAELKTLVTERQGRPVAGSDYHAVLQQREQVATRLDMARTDAARAANRLEQLAAMRDQAQTHDAPEVIEALKQAVAIAADQITKAQHIRVQLQQVEAELHGHEAGQREALRLLTEFEAKRDQLAAAERENANDTEAVEVLEGRVKAAEDARASIYEHRAAAEAEVNAVGSAMMMLDQAALALELGRRQAQLQSDLQVAEQVAAEITSLERQQAANPLSDGRMQALEREHAAIMALEAAAVSIEVSYLPGGQNKVRLDGHVLLPGTPLRIDEPIVLDIDGVGSLRIVPGEMDATDARDDLAAHRAVFADLLREVGAEDVAAARELRSDQQQRAVAVAEARAKLNALTPHGLEALKSQLAKCKTDAPSVPADSFGGDRAEVEARLDATRTAFSAAQTEASKAEAAYHEASAELQRRGVDAAARRKIIVQFTADLPDVALRDAHHAKLIESREVADAVVGRSVVAQRELASAGVDDAAFSFLEDKQRSAEHARDDHARIGQRQREDMRGLEGEIAGANEDGSELLVQELGEQLSTLDRRVAAFELRVESLGLIKEALEHAASSTRDRFLAPVVKRMVPYFEIVFPGAELQFGDGLDLSALTRQQQSENLSTLSEGTQEQIAVLVRLGFGRLLADSGAPMPLILDDALVYSDDARIARVFDALAAGADHHQVIVLTCRTRTFAPLAGHRLELSDWKTVEAS